ncbi:hypothetical protein [Paraflavitalea speifideaquila]|uniref:hypothetical protein n=1 Tax=Paraflavitalea speifideaquila TaxID=3076558 RepID=UPI0028E7EA8B|nr:hypothetical protein [Paraflavitalea speifideiaquila]
MKVLMTGPNNNPETAVGGILTIVNTILNNSAGEISYFDRDLGKLVSWLPFKEANQL